MNLVYLWLLQFEKISTCDLGLPEIVHVSYRIPTCELGTLVTVAVWFCFSTCDLSLPETVHVIQNTYLWAWYTCDCCSLNTWLYLWTWFTWYCSCLNVVLPVNLIWLLVNISTCEFVCKIHFIVFWCWKSFFVFRNILHSCNYMTGSAQMNHIADLSSFLLDVSKHLSRNTIFGYSTFSNNIPELNFLIFIRAV